MTTTEKDLEQAKAQAKAQIETICEMMDALEQARESEDGEAEWEGDKHDEDSLDQIISENALSVQVRSDWHEPGSENGDGGEFEILLCTGGPAVRIIGELDEHNQPDRCRVQYQDWFTPWTDYFDMTTKQSETVLEYCQRHYFDN